MNCAMHRTVALECIEVLNTPARGGCGNICCIRYMFLSLDGWCGFEGWMISNAAGFVMWEHLCALHSHVSYRVACRHKQWECALEDTERPVENVLSCQGSLATNTYRSPNRV